MKKKAAGQVLRPPGPTSIGDEMLLLLPDFQIITRDVAPHLKAATMLKIDRALRCRITRSGERCDHIRCAGFMR